MGKLRARARTHRRTFPNTESLGPDIEEGTIRRRPLQALFLLPQGSARPAAAPGTISLHPTDYVIGVGLLRKLRPLSVAIEHLIVRGLLT